MKRFSGLGLIPTEPPKFLQIASPAEDMELKDRVRNDDTLWGKPLGYHLRYGTLTESERKI